MKRLLCMFVAGAATVMTVHTAPASTAAPTFAKDVAPILLKNARAATGPARLRR